MEPPKDIISPDALIGQVINQYKIAHRIGESKVFLAFKEDNPGKQVALKLFFPDPFANNHDAILDRLNEVSKLDNPNIVKVYEVGDKQDFIYAVMEYVPGKNLYDLMTLNPRLHWAAAAELAKDIVKGLLAAHQQKVLHRCLHPDRVLLGKAGQIKINFCNEGEITPSKEVVYYVPPELFLGQELSERSDIYSLGAIIYHIVIGLPPFAGKEPREVALKHRELSPVLPSYGVADIPHCLSLILCRSLDIAPQERYSNCIELQAALKNMLINDIGSYELGSYKELFRRVEVSPSDKAFTKEVEKVIKRKSAEVQPEVQPNPQPQVAPTRPKLERPKSSRTTSMIRTAKFTKMRILQAISRHTEDYLGEYGVATVGFCLLSLALNLAVAAGFHFLKLF